MYRNDCDDFGLEDVGAEGKVRRSSEGTQLYARVQQLEERQFCSWWREQRLKFPIAIEFLVTRLLCKKDLLKPSSNVKIAYIPNLTRLGTPCGYRLLILYR